MTQRKPPPFLPRPRIWSKSQVCARFQRCVSWFDANRSELEAQGFPTFDQLLGGWDSQAVERWFDRRAGIDARCDDRVAKSEKTLDEWAQS